MNNIFLNSITEHSIENNNAIICSDTLISYSELSERIFKIKNDLENIYKIQERALVMLVVPRCLKQLELMTTMFSANIAYCNIDYNEKPERINRIISNSPPHFIITTAEKKQEMLLDNYALVNNYNDFYVYKCNDDLPLFDMDVAYVLYTSGTTGIPKGVVISTEAALNFIYAVEDIFKFEYQAKVLCNTAFNFDISFLESITSFYYGLTVVLLDEKSQNNPKKMCLAITEQNIDLVQMTPTLLTNIYLYFRGKFDSFSSVKRLLIGGEKFPVNLYPHLKEINGLEVYNMYGPTEATVWATYKLLDDGEITIGSSMKGYNVFVVEDGKIVKDRSGEICISGKSVAFGYLNDPEMTQKRFCKDISGYSDMMYKTGDLGIQKDSGEIIYIGRKDTQVKYRGHRIELGEIETALKENDKIQDAAVLLNKGDNSQSESLTCYYTSVSEINSMDIIKSLDNIIPKYMIPKKFIRIKEMPFKSNGKIDRLELERL